MRNDPYWREGYAAYDRGNDVDVNPHPSSSLAFHHWHAGWAAAEQDNMAYMEKYNG